MQHDPDTEAQFWNDDSTRSSRRASPRHPSVGSRSHTQQIPLIRRRATEPQADASAIYDDERDPDLGSHQVAVVSSAPRRGRRLLSASTVGNLAAADPLVKRVGVMMLTAALLVPVALSLRPDQPSTLRTEAAAQDAPAVTLPVSAGQTALPDTTVSPAPAVVATEPVVVAAPSEAAPPATAAPATDAPSTAAPASSQQEVVTATTQAETVSVVNEAATPQVAAKKVVCAKSYTVVAGDYWILIAQKNSITLAELLKANAATVDTALFAGRSICLPANASTPTTVAATTTTVKPPSTTAPPTTAPPSTQPPASYTRAQVIQIIRDVWPDDLEEKAIQIATRESNLIPTAKNYCCYGLFQIYFSVHKSWLQSMYVVSAEQLFDPRINATAALALYNRSGGWGPWAQTAG